MNNQRTSERRTNNCNSPYKFYSLEILISGLIGYIVFLASAPLVAGLVFMILMVNPTNRLNSVLNRCNTMKKFGRNRRF